ncbi:xanthine dehydrogenase family protein molybdopterin-binding subunit [Extensimonas vulgaris]|uniref:Carbon-monoxide dehydrogenase large subunit n=1 Tax=Extensimonas vulgaris TaxID=1031594 RepID=A0A369AN26_9BURK|nr:xanthine dehydrogenase family protein molybdopterin-binding subunit [Extensimonas vulgaris]RCX09728.1 carbon-monoxide dehydrogenase large subunit [Extensimonas vulgaris]TWI39358.1 carbon-monoxide dehydrogenase large subunit [Extensimonas vulgaris]TXD15608.1 xanthine dehydrogenase family protein [Extensimonas vulgaris]
MSADTPTQRFGSGQAVRRLEDDALLTGAGRYTEDLRQPGDGCLVFVRSPYAHARIVGVKTDDALAMPGVRAVLTGAQLVAEGVPPMPTGAAFPRADGSPCATPQRLPLAHEAARFVGEAVAAVVADSVQQAKDAAEAVWVEYEELPVVPSLAAALAEGAPALWPAAPDNIACEARHGDAVACAAAFAQAAHVVRLDLTHQRLAALTLEPRTVRAWPEDGRMQVQISSQMPTAVRTVVAKALGVAPEQVRVRVGDVGGGFGMKGAPYPEDVVVALAARATGRPVVWAAERSEEFLSSCHGRDVQTHAELALAADGAILGLRVHSNANVGAYAQPTGVAIPLLIGPWVQTSVYHVPVIDFHFRAVLTNQAPTGAYRGAGRPEAIYNIERLMDEAARQTGIDRLQLRRRNFVRPEQMPYTNPMQQTYDVGRFEQVLDGALPLADWAGFEARAAESRARGLWRGLGIATFLEWTGGNVFEERVTVEVKGDLSGDGFIEVFSAVNQMGQGIATTLAQLVVDAFDVPIERVRVVLGDTDRGNGFGSAGSRSIFTGGSALRTGAERTLDEARKLAAQALEAAPEDLRYAAGRFHVAGTDHAIGLFELAARQAGGHIFVEHSYTVSGPSWPNGCHISEVELDPQTGAVAVVRYASMNDVGRVVNPMIVRGQLDGGAVQGIGQALHEQIVYDGASGQLLTGSLMDYAAPRADDIATEFITAMDESIPCTNNPLGVKGVGELGTIGATPCIVNAVADALARNGRADLAPKLQMPLSPGRLWELLLG